MPNMEASLLLQFYISSALLLLAILWVCAVLYRYAHTDPAKRWKFSLLLLSCALTCACDVVLCVLDGLQLREESMSRSPPLCFATEILTQLRKGAVSPGARGPNALLLDLDGLLPCTSPYPIPFTLTLTVGSPFSFGTALFTCGNQLGLGSSMHAFSFLQ